MHDFDGDAGRRDCRCDCALAGEHNVRNALAAAAACACCSTSAREAIGAGLKASRPVAGRGVTSCCINGATLIDDTYNANPDSVRAAIDVLAAAPAPRVLVLGDMGEVGDQGPEFHREVGAVRDASAASMRSLPSAR